MSLTALNTGPIDHVVADDLSPYRGQWVAIRDRKIVASAVDVTTLRDLPEVADNDLLLLVPTEMAGAYLL